MSVLGRLSGSLVVFHIVNIGIFLGRNKCHFGSSSAQFSSVQGGIYALGGKAHNVLHPVSREFPPNVALETVPMLVSLMLVLSCPLKEDRSLIASSSYACGGGC